MKLTKETLKQIIKEELEATLGEGKDQGDDLEMTDFDAEVLKLRKSGLSDMEIAKTIAAKTGQPWDTLMYDIMNVN